MLTTESRDSEALRGLLEKSAATLEGAWRNQKQRTHAVSAAEFAPSASPPPVLLTEREAAAVLGVGPRKFHALRSEPWMPAAIELGPRCLRWNRDELIQAVAARAPRRTLQAEPAHFQQARARREVVTK